MNTFEPVFPHKKSDILVIKWKIFILRQKYNYLLETFTETLLCLFFHFLRWSRNISASWFVPSISEIWSDSIGAHLLLYRQRMVHIPAGISDYCWSLPPDPGVPSEDASQVLFFIISLRCCGSVSDRHCPSVSSSSSEIEAERFPAPRPSSRDIELALANAFKASSRCRYGQSRSASCPPYGG